MLLVWFFLGVLPSTRQVSLLCIRTSLTWKERTPLTLSINTLQQWLASRKINTYVKTAHVQDGVRGVVQKQAFYPIDILRLAPEAIENYRMVFRLVVGGIAVGVMQRSL